MQKVEIPENNLNVMTKFNPVLHFVTSFHWQWKTWFKYATGLNMCAIVKIFLRVDGYTAYSAHAIKKILYVARFNILFFCFFVDKNNINCEASCMMSWNHFAMQLTVWTERRIKPNEAYQLTQNISKIWIQCSEISRTNLHLISMTNLNFFS